jgi:DNA modification methylase
LIERAIVASSNKGDLVLDPFVGSGTTAEAALQADREFIAGDSNSEAIDVMKKRFAGFKVEFA